MRPFFSLIAIMMTSHTLPLEQFWWRHNFFFFFFYLPLISVPREQVNAATAFLDASTVYGSTQELQTLLRQATPNDTGYLLATSANDLLPHDPEAFCIARQGDFCFLAGKNMFLAKVLSIYSLIARSANRTQIYCSRQFYSVGCSAYNKVESKADGQWCCIRESHE